MIRARPLLFGAGNLERSCLLTQHDLSNDWLGELTHFGLCSDLPQASLRNAILDEAAC